MLLYSKMNLLLPSSVVGCIHTNDSKLIRKLETEYRVKCHGETISSM